MGRHFLKEHLFRDKDNCTAAFSRNFLIELKKKSPLKIAFYWGKTCNDFCSRLRGKACQCCVYTDDWFAFLSKTIIELNRQLNLRAGVYNK